MIVMKFGGTSVGSIDALVANCPGPVDGHRPCVVAALAADDDPVDARQIEGAEIL